MTIGIETCKLLPPDLIWIRIVAADSIRDSIWTEIFDSQVPSEKITRVAVLHLMILLAVMVMLCMLNLFSSWTAVFRVLPRSDRVFGAYCVEWTAWTQRRDNRIPHCVRCSLVDGFGDVRQFSASNTSRLSSDWSPSLSALPVYSFGQDKVWLGCRRVSCRLHYLVSKYVGLLRKYVIIIIIIIPMTMFIVMSSWPQGHCESSLGSLDECRTAPSSRRPSDQATWLGLWVRL